MSSSYYSASSYREDDFPEEDKDFFAEEQNFKDCILFAIDCSESMFSKNAQGEVPVTVALQSLRSTILNKIDSRPNDQVGVVLYGTKEFNNSARKEHIAVLHPIDIPDAPRIKEIDSYIQDISLLQERYGTTDQSFPISDLFYVCSDMMSKVKNSVRRLFLITDNDDPTDGSAEYRKASIQRAKDLGIANIEITLFGLDKPDRKFNTNIFYKDISAFDDNSVSSTGKLTELLDMVKTNYTKLRSEFRIPFQITPSVTVGIKGYNLIIEEKLRLPKNFTTNVEKIVEVKPLTRWRCTDSEQILMPMHLKHGFQYGEELVEFTKEEIKKLKKIRDPSLLVLGFKNKKALKAHHQLTHPYFIFPDETQYEGSSKLFMALVQTMLIQDRIAICSFVRRENTSPRIVAAIPQDEKLDENGNQLEPPGLQLIILPYADEIRPLPPAITPVQVNPEVRESAKAIINKLAIDYDPSHFDNPYIANHKKYIQTIALGGSIEDEKLVDDTLPKFDYIESNVSQELDVFKKTIGLDNIMSDELHEYSKPASVKRKTTGEESTAVKKPKKEDMDIPEMWQNGVLGSATNLFMKDFLAANGIQPRKLKKDLMAQIESYLTMKQEQ
ncbi:SPOC like C-terminal domain-containing protein [Helicostylum pulchrum]|nr:SPOC like C-terminal domain-containing protein [Helicostylum pulchrum]